MPPRLQKTALSVTYETAPGQRSFVYEMADTDRESFAFDAEGPITGATVVMTDLGSGVAVTAPIEAESHAGQIQTVVVSGLTRGVDYELAVTFENSAGRKWTRTLTIACVA